MVWETPMTSAPTLQTVIDDAIDVQRRMAAEIERLRAVNAELRAALTKAACELNAIRARDGAPQHIAWDRGRPIQSDSCTHEYWDALVEECHAALRRAQGE